MKEGYSERMDSTRAELERTLGSALLEFRGRHVAERAAPEAAETAAVSEDAERELVALVERIEASDKATPLLKAYALVYREALMDPPARRAERIQFLISKMEGLKSFDL